MSDQEIIVPKARPGRKAKTILILGGNGCGKSSAAFNIMQKTGHGLMVLPSFDDWAEIIPEIEGHKRAHFQFEGVRHLIFNDDSDFRNIYNHFHDGFLTLDDCRAYVDSNFDHSYLKKILQRRRQMMVDVILMAHGFSEVPPKLFTFVTDYIIFNVTDEPKIRKQYIPPEVLMRLEKTVSHVRKLAIKNPHACLPVPVVPD